MTSDDIIEDMRDRLFRAAGELSLMRDEEAEKAEEDAKDWRFAESLRHTAEAARLEGKREGVMLAADYLRAYPPAVVHRTITGVDKETRADGVWHIFYFDDGSVERAQLG